MRTATITIEGVSPVSFSKMIPKEISTLRTGEDHDAAEKRMWRERVHVDEKGFVFLPQMAFKWGLEAAAKYRGEKIRGKGNKQWGAKFAAGVLPPTVPLTLPIQKDDVPGDWLFVPSDGKHGGSKRVPKCFPVVRQWGGSLEMIVVDDEITKEIFEKTFSDFGLLVGVGRFRPERGGYYGRFTVKSIKWS